MKPLNRTDPTLRDTSAEHMQQLPPSDLNHEKESLLRLDGEDADEARVYRRIYAVLTLMTFALVVINIIQVCLLTHINSLGWIVGFPLAVFGAFLLWVGAIVLANAKLFRMVRLRDVSDGLFYLRQLFRLHIQQTEQQPTWPRNSARIGVLATIILNVVLVEFIYLPIFALPAFKQNKWDITLTVEQPKTPAVAVYQFPNEYQNERAFLPLNNGTWEDICTENNSEVGNCISDEIHTYQGALYSQGPEVVVDYAIYNDQENITNRVGNGYNLYYPFTYNVTGGSILSLVAFLDPAFVELFPLAWSCGLFVTQELYVRDSQQIVLNPVKITDKLNAFGRTSFCDIEAFSEYTRYEATLNDWGQFPSRKDWRGCGFNTSEDEAIKPCTSGIQFIFSSDMMMSYESKHGAGWLNILTAEGGVIGFVTFITWFFGIFLA